MSIVGHLEGIDGEVVNLVHDLVCLDEITGYCFEASHKWEEGHVS